MFLTRAHDDKNQALIADESGVAFVWVAVFILLIFGFIGLAIDGGRYFNLNSDLQQIADAAALAGAKELDGSEGSRRRAEIAASTVLNENSPHRSWSNVPADGIQIDLDVNKPTFHYYDADLGGTGGIRDAESDEEAQYITVTTIKRELTTSFLRALIPKKSAYATATATAKVEYTVCKPLQSFLCNPWEHEAAERGAARNWKDNVQPGFMFKLTSGAGSSANGSWGLIDPEDPDDNSPAALTKFWAALAPDQCVAQGVGVRQAKVLTGNLSSFAQAGMNVRFGIEIDHGNPHRMSGIEVAAPITIKGMVVDNGLQAPLNGASCSSPKSSTPPAGSNCVFPESTRSGAAYRDYCYTTYTNSLGNYQKVTNNNPPCSALLGGTERIGSCPLPRDEGLVERPGSSYRNFVMGAGPNLLDLKAYWKNQHGTEPWPWGSDTPTRYDIYLYEVQNRDRVGFFRADSLEDRAPYCLPFGDADRRLINVAIVDCDYWRVNGTSTSADDNRLPAVTTVARFFITEPAGADGALYAEYVDSFESNGANGVVYKTVKLVE